MNAKLNRRIAGAVLLLIAALLVAVAAVPGAQVALQDRTLPSPRSPRRICIDEPCDGPAVPAVAYLSTGTERRLCVNWPCDRKWIVPGPVADPQAQSARPGGWGCLSWPCPAPTSTGTAGPVPEPSSAPLPGGCIDLMCPRGFFRDAWCRCRPLPVVTPASQAL